MARTAKTTSAEVRQRAAAAREHLQVALERVEYADGTADPSAAGARRLRAVKTAPARVGTRSRPHVVGGAGASQLTESCCLPSEVT